MLLFQASGQEAAVIMGQTQVMIVSQLLGVEIQHLVVRLTHKETVGTLIELQLNFIRY